MLSHSMGGFHFFLVGLKNSRLEALWHGCLDNSQFRKIFKSHLNLPWILLRVLAYSITIIWEGEKGRGLDFHRNPFKLQRCFFITAWKTPENQYKPAIKEFIQSGYKESRPVALNFQWHKNHLKGGWTQTAGPQAQSFWFSNRPENLHF